MRAPVSSQATKRACRSAVSAWVRCASNAAFVRLNMFISAPSLIERPNRSRIAMRSRS
jgi:hypothetical protein